MSSVELPLRSVELPGANQTYAATMSAAIARRCDVHRALAGQHGRDDLLVTRYPAFLFVGRVQTRRSRIHVSKVGAAREAVGMTSCWMSSSPAPFRCLSRQEEGSLGYGLLALYTLAMAFVHEKI